MAGNKHHETWGDHQKDFHWKWVKNADKNEDDLAES